MASDAEQQQQRTFLRERFLRLLTAIKGQPAEFVMFNHQTVAAKFLASDIDVLNFQVSQLETPLGVIPTAVLRSTDVISFTVSLPSPPNDANTKLSDVKGT